MSDKELFNEVLKRFEEQYRLTITHPYGDGAIEVRNQSGTLVGEMNSDGYNLLYNLTRLCEMLQQELI